jgi:hypothetical protein
LHLKASNGSENRISTLDRCISFSLAANRQARSSRFTAHFHVFEENLMSRKHFTVVSLALLAALALSVTPQLAWAQGSGFQDAGAKIRGDAYWPGRATSRYIETARNYAQEVQTYVAKAPKPEPSVVKDIKSDLSHYLEDAQKHLATMKKDFANDKETMTAVESIEKGLTTAIQHNKEMIACCENQTFDKVATMTCCKDLVKELDKVHADHVALMKKLSAKYAATPAAPEKK